MNFSDYVSQDAIGLADLIRRREVSAIELANAALARMDEVNPRINAVVHRYDHLVQDAARAEDSDGQFHGVPFLLKDLPDGALAGTPLTLGSRSMVGHRALHDSTLVKRYRQAGVIFIGATNTPELGLMGTTEPEVHGPTRNPWDHRYSSGGSSGGAAAAVAAGIVPVAHANDGGGSIRIPASACGVFGLKPSRGRITFDGGETAAWEAFSVPHVVSRTVRDSAAFLDVAIAAKSGEPFPDKHRGTFLAETRRDPGKLRIALIRKSILGEHTHPECAAGCNYAARLLAQLGHEVEEATLPIDASKLRLAYLTIVAACTAAEIEAICELRKIPVSHQFFEAATWFMAQVGWSAREGDLVGARTAIAEATAAIAEFQRTYDLILTPTMAYPPSPLGMLTPTPVQRLAMATMRSLKSRMILRPILSGFASGMIERTPNTMLFNMTGQPAMSVPLHWNADGLPVGIQFAARLGEEATLFRLAAQLETASPWVARRAMHVPSVQ